MFDPDREVVVVVNGEERARKRLERDPATLLECILENIDPEQVFAYRIDLQRPTRLRGAGRWTAGGSDGPGEPS